MATTNQPVVEYIAQEDPETQTWAVYDLSNGLPVPGRTGLTEQEARLAAEDLNATGEVQQRPAPVNQTLEQQAEFEARKNQTLTQAALQARYKQPGNADWRVRIQLAAQSDYLYNAPDAGILKPLKNSNGVVFPYTPNIETSYKANYERYDLTHSNYRGLFYRNSSVDDISVRGTFTAQDSKEAEYLLAVIHFFRSATKMFYGQDANRGAPPPIVYLTGLGDFQFAGHPCVISNFSYSLPSDVDYIRANSFNLYGADTLNQRVQSNGPSRVSADQVRRDLLARVGINAGAVPSKPIQSLPTRTVNNTERATYVPTKMEINITMIPVQTRDQLSKQFSVKDFANGNLLRGGFW